MDGGMFEKLKILSDGAKYDASCATSGVDRANVGRVGNACAAGVCHSWTADGRCVSLLKVLFTNDCVYDCKYCVNRRSSDIARAAFEPNELASLVMEFYRRNYIEGLFLSSAVAVSPDHTAEGILKCLTLLREECQFAGYIHAKIIPGASPELVHRIGMAADRISVNVELPSQESLARLAPQKNAKGIFAPMRQIAQTMAEQKTLKGPGSMGRMGAAGANVAAGDGSLAEMCAGRNPLAPVQPGRKYKERFAPGGQSTQMIIGASPENDRQIIKTSEGLYRAFKLKRVYFSAYIPVVDSPELPAMCAAPPLKREHRLYQADWLLRFYGFSADEILDEAHPFLDTELDPKISWALRNIGIFPIEVNKAPLEALLRIPGVGTTSAMRIVRQRRVCAVKYDDLKKIGVVLSRARYFLTCSGRYYGGAGPDPVYIRGKALSAPAVREGLAGEKGPVQISLFDQAPGPGRLEGGAAPALGGGRRPPAQGGENGLSV
jgi:putative DNA modification/repair radical SAM protein